MSRRARKCHKWRKKRTADVSRQIAARACPARGLQVAKLTDTSRRNGEGNVLDVEARFELCENCIYGLIVWQEVV